MKPIHESWQQQTKCPKDSSIRLFKDVGILFEIWHYEYDILIGGGGEIMNSLLFSQGLREYFTKALGNIVQRN